MATHDNSGYPLVLHSSADPTTLGGTAICGFSTVGSVGVIAMSHIIQTLDLDPMGTVLHPEFPAIALIHEWYQNIQYESIKETDSGYLLQKFSSPPQNDVHFGETV